MYKQASANQQSRVVRAILERRTNDGLDPATFSGLKDVEKVKDRLIHEQKAIDTRIGVLNAHIERADAVRREGGGATRAKTYGGWKIERADLARQRHEIDAQLRDLKHYSASAREERLGSFNSTFVDMAREMLAAEVFSRIQMATIHRIAEREVA